MFSVIFLQTIWALGVSMIALSLLIFLPKRVLLVLSLLIIFGHNALDSFHVPGDDLKAMAWSLVHDQRLFTFGDFRLLVAYPVLSWIGVMGAGYCFGEIFQRYTGTQRKRLLTIIGLTCIIVFVVLRYSNIYGDQSLWSTQKSSIFTMLSFMDTTKYPPSLLYILMTLGPAILFMALAEKPLNRVTAIISIYGRVPMFYYILHLYFIHVGFIIVGLIQGYSASSLFHANILRPLAGFGFGLWGVYLVWIILVAILYPLCKRFDEYKRANKHKWWLSYL